MRIVVIGSGIVGSAVAFNLARSGANVTIVSAHEEGPATRASFGWINATAGNAPRYALFRMRAMAEWAALAAAHPGLPVTREGALVWDLGPAERRAFLDEGLARGYDLSTLDRAAIRALEPALRDPPEEALRAIAEGAAEPAAAARWLRDAAVAAGALHRHATATGLDLRGGRIAGVATEDGVLPADHVVIAAGVASPAIAADAGVSIPLRPAPGITVMTAPAPRAIGSILVAPEAEIRQTMAGAFAVAGSLRDGEPAREAGERLHGRLAALLAIDTPPIEDIRVADRPMPADGHPIAGLVDGVSGLSVAVTHSGVTLAPLLGRLVAEEARGGEPHPLLADWSPARFAQGGQERMRAPAGS